eukprot:GHUV01025646.1.p1 GENE.GHUV01025646.1~~GHUV01025646.1.p1  ORF type:complete len:250 (+),score=109.20 GHUV01025646.1:1132-1881(+)
MRRPPAGSAASPASIPAAAGASPAAAQAAAAPALAAAAAPAAHGKKQQQKSGLTVERKRKATDPPGTAETVEVQLQLDLPAQLQKQLLDQYDAVHDDNKLAPLPRRPNVMQILQNYTAWVKDKKQESQAEEDIVMGLQVYFDKALYQCLLYRSERRQADQALAAGQAPSAVYGAEHLLRLFVKLPELLPHTGAPEEQLQLLLRRMDDLMAYMQHQSAKIFAPISDYVAAATYGAIGGGHGVVPTVVGKH